MENVQRGIRPRSVIGRALSAGIRADAYRRIRAGALRAPRLTLVVYTLLVGVTGIASIPPVDRDEAYFAQAAKQMVESGDLVDIRFQDQPRYKKPILIYWLQAGAASLWGGPERDRIWAYRLPSVVATVIAVLILYEIGLILFGASAGLTAAALTAATVLLQTQSHQARADALLLATVMGCMWPLARAYCLASTTTQRQTPVLGIGLVVLFWMSLSAGLLAKGPVTPGVVLLTAGALVLSMRSMRWLSPLRPRIGVLVFLLVLLPWPVAMLATHGPEFFVRAVAGDLLPKIVGTHESHGAPPLYHALLLPLTFWPASLLLPRAVYFAWQARRGIAVRFCLAWCLPTWLLFELLPTKLPHYVLPVLPAIALLAAGSMPVESPSVQRLVRLGSLAFALLGTALVTAALVVSARFASTVDAVTIGWAALLLAAIVLASVQAWRRARAPTATLLACGLVSSIFLFQVVAPRLDQAWIAARAAAAVRALIDPRRCPVVIAGYPEPSLVFLLGTDSQLLGPVDAAAHLAAEPGSAALVRGDLDAGFLAAARSQGHTPIRRSVIGGIDPVHGHRIQLTLWLAPCNFAGGERSGCCRPHGTDRSALPVPSDW